MAATASSAPSADRVTVLASLTAGAVLLILALRSLYSGMGQSYDSLLYARSLWGIAHGAWVNPAYGTHAFAIHLNLGLLPLAPLCWVLPAAVVLAIAQAAAFAGTLGLFMRAAAERGVAMFAAALLLLSPLIVNPFLFDLRPGVVGVPLAFAGLLRLRERQAMDRGVVAWLLAAAMIREEFAVIGAAGLVLAPLGRGALRQRVLAAAALVAYFGLYWWGLRPLLAGDDRADVATAALFAGDATAWTYRLHLLVALATTLGAVCWRGWRWAGAAVPGIGLIVLLAKLPEHALSFHYAMFAAPGLLIAAVDGLSRHARLSRQAIALHGAFAIAATLAYSAIPGGARFQADAFGFDTEAQRWQAEVHATLDAIPDDAGVVVPGPFAARLADRRTIYSLETYHAEIQRTGSAPPDVDIVVLAAQDWASLGRWLVHQADFQRVAIVGQRFAVLHRGAAGALNPALAMPTNPPPPCAAPEVAWPAVGLAACRSTVEAELVVVRIGSPSAPVPPLALERGDDATWSALWLESGLVHPGQLPVGAWAVAPTARPLAAGTALRLVDASGREVPAADVRGPAPTPASPFRF